MRNVSAATINSFSQIFAGHKGFYGTSTPTNETTEKGKRVFNSFTQTVSEGAPELSRKLYAEHLEGKKGIGVSPIDENNNCRFGVIDIDVYPLNPNYYIDLANDYELPLCFFRSKSGGLHCYIFFSEDVKASKVRGLLTKFLLIFGLPIKTEVFPKQDKLYSTSKPSWINLPYFGQSDSYMYGVDHEPLSIERALHVIENKKITFDSFQLKYDNLPLNDGPVCLQSLYMRSSSMQDGDGRNNYLFNLGVYYKAADSAAFEENIHMANSRLVEPKKDSEIQNQIIKPISKKSYSYRCSEHPLNSCCNPELCAQRKFGKGGDEISSLTFEELKQVKTDPPYYIWIVNGQEMEFYKESELRNQNSFADQCMRYLHLVPNMIKQARWNAILKKAFLEIVIVEKDLEDDASPGALLWQYFKEFVEERPRAQSKEQIKAGYIYMDKEKELYVFKKQPFLQYLSYEKRHTEFTSTQIQKRLFDLGVRPSSFYVKQGWIERVWTIPFSFIKNEQKLEDDRIDFNDLRNEKEEF